jgi:hypothetical protein
MAKKARKSLRDWMTAILADAKRQRVEPAKAGSRRSSDRSSDAGGTREERPRRPAKAGQRRQS